jgi:hypothetical protein
MMNTFCHLKCLYHMKPTANTGRPAKFLPTPFAIKSPARVITHPLSKKAEESHIPPPDEETLLRLNAMAKQYPFCILHREKDSNLL